MGAACCGGKTYQPSNKNAPTEPEKIGILNTSLLLLEDSHGGTKTMTIQEKKHPVI
jgi:hypothetical protein